MDSNKIINRYQNYDAEDENKAENKNESVCEKHPECKLRKALADLVGASTMQELKVMELFLRTKPGPERDKIVSLNAIRALIETA